MADSSLVIEVERPAGRIGPARPIEFFPETAGVLDNAAPRDGTVERQPLDGARAAVGPARREPDAHGRGAGARRQHRGRAGRLRDRRARGRRRRGACPEGCRRAEPAARTAPPLGLAAALLFALLGGALLNLMPCVFPVLSLKVLGFAAHADDRRALAARRPGLHRRRGAVLRRPRRRCCSRCAPAASSSAGASSCSRRPSSRCWPRCSR